MTEEDTSWHEGHNQWLRGYNARVDEERARRAEAMVYVCPRKDIVCGSRPENWCIECPLRSQGASGLSPEALDSDEKENPGVGVRVGATPEPRWVQVMRAEVAETKHFKVGSVTHLYEMAVAFYDEFARAALRAPEPLTAEPFARVKVERKFGAGTLTVWTWLRGHIDQLPEGEHDLYTARAALEGGVSPQQGWNEGFVKGHAMASEIRDIDEALIAARAKFGLEGGVSRTEPALTDEQIEALAAEHAETGKYEGYFVWFKFHNSSHLIRFARAIATKSHPSGDQGL